ncbi:MAG: acetylglutamate kinase [Gemmatimonadota bacterium]
MSGRALAAALEYAAAWNGKTVVVKVGGSVLRGGDPGTVPRDLALLHLAGVRVVVVHGGGPEVSRALERLGIRPTFVNGLRVTDATTLEVVEMVLTGRVNPRLVARLGAAGAPAVGLSGRDGGLLRVRPHPEAERLGFVGQPERVDPRPLVTLLEEGFLPVISPIGAGADGTPYNVNADAVAAAIAPALGAEKLILLTDVPGVLRDTPEGPELVSEIDAGGIRRLAAEGVISRGMVPKVNACLAAIAGGVASAHIVVAAAPHGLLLELFTEEGIGTMIRSGDVAFPRRAVAEGGRR